MFMAFRGRPLQSVGMIILEVVVCYRAVCRHRVGDVRISFRLVAEFFPIKKGVDGGVLAVLQTLLVPLALARFLPFDRSIVRLARRDLIRGREVGLLQTIS